MRREQLLCISILGACSQPTSSSQPDDVQTIVSPIALQLTDGSGLLFRIFSEVPSLSTWSMGIVEADWKTPAGSYVDKTMQLGYNYEYGQRQNPDEPAVFLQFESLYQPNASFDPTFRVTETHLSGQDVTGREHRYFSNMSSWDGQYGETALSGTQIIFYDWLLSVLGKLSSAGMFLTVPISIQTDSDTLLTIADRSGDNLYFEVGKQASTLRSALFLDAAQADGLTVNNRVGDTVLSLSASNAARLAQIQLGTNGWLNFLHNDPRNDGGRIQFFYNTGGVYFHDPSGVVALQITNGGALRIERELFLGLEARLGADAMLTWAGDTEPTTVADVGLGRAAPGLLEVNRADHQTLADLSVRHIVAIGDVPMLSGCGAGALLTGDDTAGTVRVGSGVTSCSVAFAATFSSVPTCVVSSSDGIALTYERDATHLTVSSANLGGRAFDYICVGH